MVQHVLEVVQTVLRWCRLFRFGADGLVLQMRTKWQELYEETQVGLVGAQLKFLKKIFPKIFFKNPNFDISIFSEAEKWVVQGLYGLLEESFRSFSKIS